MNRRSTYNRRQSMLSQNSRKMSFLSNLQKRSKAEGKEEKDKTSEKSPSKTVDVSDTNESELGDRVEESPKYKK